MDKTNAIRLLDDTFSDDFDTQRFSKFIKELFNHFAFVQKTWPVWNEYQDYIDSYSSLGSYVDSSKKVIDILVVKLRRTSSRDRARTMQRNFVAKYLGNAEKDAALVAFYGDDEDWRFSFVKMEYNLTKDDEGKVKIVKELTPAKRYSFLVGRNEPNHTCKRQFIELLVEEEIIPTLETIESAFSVDNVTKEFFTEYKELFLELNESLQKVLAERRYIKKEFEDKGISTVDFSKKLIGQIVFIYFLQKKGWLGVSKDGDGRFKQWGTGPRNFLRKLFDKEIASYSNFFNDVLEPLFYEALATERDDDYYSRFNCKIPFLNGGLFEPINDYDWAGIEITLDNKIFGRILSTFDRFNFTVKEDEPLEIEVAVDPEMLGKVFENLLEVTDRKSKGAFYTPREIVHYMCQQSLISYLATNTLAIRKDIEKFIQLGDLALSQIIREQEQIKKYGKSYDVNERFSIPKSIKENYLSIDELLREIRIVDPAVGSGAFPVGMMNEIVKARSLLSIFYRTEKQTERTNYSLKRETIENCLYGVDTEPSAVEIKKLRFWLSLIVDELDMENIKPLPNLDHKIMCGNSLSEEFEGIVLFDERLLGESRKDYTTPEITRIDEKIAELSIEKGQIALGKRKGRSIKDIDKEIKKLLRKKEEIRRTPRTAERNLTLDESIYKRVRESRRKLDELRRLQKDYFDAQNRKTKSSLREQIDKIEWELIEETLKEQGNEAAIEKLKQYKKNRAKPFFLWKLYFAEVFQRHNPGFDVVIANPPYVFGGHQWISKEEKEAFKSKFYSGTKKINLFNIFIEQGVRLLRRKGFQTYITPNTLLRVTSYSNIREFLVNNTTLLEIMDLDVGVFENVTASTIVFSLVNEKSQLDNEVKIKRNMEPNNYNVLKQREFRNKGFVFNIFSNSVDRSIISKLKQDSCSLGSKCKYIRFGVVITKNRDKVVKDRKINDEWKRFLEGNEIGRYYINYKGEYLHYKKELLHRSRTPDVFLSKKIMVQRITGGLSPLKAVYDDKGFFDKESIINIILNDAKEDDYKFVLGILNSKLINWYYLKEFSNESKLTVNLSKEYLSEIPIKENKFVKEKIIGLVNQILSITNDSEYSNKTEKQEKVTKFEEEIDQLVFRLYELTPEEIKAIEKG
jgi:hypothetical protein